MAVVTSLKDFVRDNMPSAEDIRRNAESATREVLTAGLTSFDALKLGKQITAQMTGVKNEAMPVVAMGERGRSGGIF